MQRHARMFWFVLMSSLWLCCQGGTSGVPPLPLPDEPGSGWLWIEGDYGGSVFTHRVMRGPKQVGQLEIDLSRAKAEEWYFSEGFIAAASDMTLQDSEGVGYELTLQPSQQGGFLRILHTALRPGWHNLDLPVAMFKDDLLWNRRFARRVGDRYRVSLRADSRPVLQAVTRTVLDAGRRAKYSIGASEELRYSQASVHVTDVASGASVACTGYENGPLQQRPEGGGTGTEIFCPATVDHLRFELQGFFAHASGLPLTDVLGGPPTATIDWQGDDVDRQAPLDKPGALAVWVDRRVPVP